MINSGRLGKSRESEWSRKRLKGQKMRVFVVLASHIHCHWIQERDRLSLRERQANGTLVVVGTRQAGDCEKVLKGSSWRATVGFCQNSAGETNKGRGERMKSANEKV